MKEFRIRFIDRDFQALMWSATCNSTFCDNRQYRSSGYCERHIHKATHYRVQRKFFGLWLNVRKTARLTQKEAEAAMIAAADGHLNSSVTSTWRLRDDGILEQTS